MLSFCNVNLISFFCVCNEKKKLIRKLEWDRKNGFKCSFWWLFLLKTYPSVRTKTTTNIYNQLQGMYLQGIVFCVIFHHKQTRLEGGGGGCRKVNCRQTGKLSTLITPIIRPGKEVLQGKKRRGPQPGLSKGPWLIGGERKKRASCHYYQRPKKYKYIDPGAISEVVYKQST